MAKFWHYIPDGPVAVFGAYSTSVDSSTITNLYEALDYVSYNESVRPVGTVILVYGSVDVYTFIMLDTDWFQIIQDGPYWVGYITDLHPSHSNIAAATLGGTKRNVVVLPMYVGGDPFIPSLNVIDIWDVGFGAPLNGTLYSAPKGNWGIMNYTGASLYNGALISSSTGGIYLDNLSLQGINFIDSGAFTNFNITTDRVTNITNMVEIPSNWSKDWNRINPNTNTYYRVKLTKMFHGANPVFGAIVNGAPVTEIKNGSNIVHKKAYGDHVPTKSTYVRNANNTVWTVNSPLDDVFESSSKKYWYRSGVTSGSMSSWSSSTTANNSIPLTFTVSQWDNHYLETYVENITPALSGKSTIVSRPRASNPLALLISNITSNGATLNISNNSEYATTGATININQNNGDNTSYTGVIPHGTMVSIPLTGVNPNTNVTVSLSNIRLSGISSGAFSQSISYTTLPAPKTSTPAFNSVLCYLNPLAYARITFTNTDTSSATLWISDLNGQNFQSVGLVSPGASAYRQISPVLLDNGRVSYSNVRAYAIASGKTQSNTSSGNSGTTGQCIPF